MVGPRAACREWMVGEDELLASGVKAPVIARQLKRSVGATYVRINELKQVGFGTCCLYHRTNSLLCKIPGRKTNRRPSDQDSIASLCYLFRRLSCLYLTGRADS
jgi:hypothetical protein